jgi:23S rRNA (cytidine1920-2'-O)/16S rRNA (cytidine1409-2'-O)-methyltransferase
MAGKVRIDRHMSESGLSESREKAKRELLSGWVKVDGETVRDPSREIAGTEHIVVERPGGLFVSRGGEKLSKALAYFSIDLAGRICADLGASTGGFTDCMLTKGAVKVYAVDVGYGQLDYRLRSDARVVVMERTNARTITKELFPDPISFVSSDLSFISFTKVYPAISSTFGAVEGVSLIKPQFEAESCEHKKGVVVKAENHRVILERTISALMNAGLSVMGLTFSPITGPKGNIEFLLHYTAGKMSDPAPAVDIAAVVDEAHASLGR